VLISCTHPFFVIKFFCLKMRSIILRHFVAGQRLFIKSRFNLSTASTSVDEGEVGRFSALANLWWDDDGPMKALRSMNRLRVPWIRDTLRQIRRQQNTNESDSSSPSMPLDGFRILDVGCGAGFLTEPLARLGANVVGIDPSLENIEVAKRHATGRKDLDYEKRLIYYSKTIEQLVEDSGKDQFYDAVVASEVIEHVSSRETFVENCLRLTKSGGGCVFFTTINRTLLSRYLAIYMAENILNIVPRGMHDWEKFISPDDLQFLLEKNDDCYVRLVHGMMYNPLTNSWSWIRNTSVNYALYGVKK